MLLSLRDFFVQCLPLIIAFLIIYAVIIYFMTKSEIKRNMRRDQRRRDAIRTTVSKITDNDDSLNDTVKPAVSLLSALKDIGLSMIIAIWTKSKYDDLSSDENTFSTLAFSIENIDWLAIADDPLCDKYDITTSIVLVLRAIKYKIVKNSADVLLMDGMIDYVIEKCADYEISNREFDGKELKEVFTS